MLPVSARFLAAVRETHNVSVTAAVYAPGSWAPVSVDVIGGEIKIDRDARVRRQGSLQVAFTLEDPTARDLVRSLPFGGYADVWRGIRYADATTERVQLGRFRVDAVVWPELQGEATLTLNDRMAQVLDEPFTDLYAPKGMKASDACVDIVRGVFGSAINYHVQTSPGSEPVLGDVAYMQDRPAALSDLASSVGAECLFDNLGDFVIRPRITSSAPAWTVDAGRRGSMIAVQETLDRSSVRNGVVIRGQSGPDTPPIWSLATYDDPSSPLRWAGPFGRVALLADSTTVTSQAQADAAARSLLNLRLGLQRTLTINSLPNPALEPDDTIELVFADGRHELQQVNSTRIGLDESGPLALTTSSTTPGVIPSLTPDRRVRFYRGRAAWRELHDAKVSSR